MHVRIQNKKMVYNVCKKALVPCISPFLAAFCRGLAVMLGWGGVRDSSSLAAYNCSLQQR